MDRGALLIAGGSWFAGEDPWTVSKTWGRDIFVLPDPANPRSRWVASGSLEEPRGNGASASSPQGVVCLGGEAGNLPTRQAFLLRWEQGRILREPLPDAPGPGAGGAAAVIGSTVYYFPAQKGQGLESTGADLWALDLSSEKWRKCAPLPAPGRAFAALVAQDNGREVCLYLLGGRRSVAGAGGVSRVQPCRELFCYSPSADRWRSQADLPVPMMAAPAVAVGSSQILVLGGDDGANFDRTPELKSAHPGFPKKSWVYDTRADRWAEGGPTPANQVAAAVATLAGEIFLVSGEVKPRHRTPAVWRIVPSTGIQKEAK